MHVITTIDRGGAENQLLLLVEEQIKLGVNVQVAYLKGNAELFNEFEAIGAKIINLAVYKDFINQILGLRRVLKQLPKNSVIHAHLPQAELLCVLSKYRQNIFIITRHFGGRFKPSSNLFLSSLLGKIASSRSNRVIAISTSVKNILIENREVCDESKIEVIKYGFNKEKFKSEIANLKNGELTLPIRIGTISRLSPEKNVNLIIEAYAELRKVLVLDKLQIIGVGPLEKELKKLSVNLGIGNEVQFLGKTKNVAQFINDLDVFVLASSFEGFGMVLLEAMSIGKRIVGSRNSAILEIIGDTKCGILFETGDKSALVDAIIKSTETRFEEIAEAQEIKLLEYEITDTAKRIMSLYQSI